MFTQEKTEQSFVCFFFTNSDTIYTM